MKFIKATGLVPVFRPANGAEVFGVTPAVALEGWKNGTLMLPEIPDDYETDEVSMPEYDDRDKEKSKAVEPEMDGQDVVIPENWEDSHWMTKDKLARAIAGDDYKKPDDISKQDYAETIIREEQARRAAKNDA